MLTERGHLGVFDIRNPDIVISRPFKSMPNVAKIHPSKPYLLCSGSNNSEMIYNTVTNNLMFTFEGHTAPITTCCWSHNGKKFATADASGLVIVWNFPKVAKVQKYKFASQTNADIYQPPNLDMTQSLEVLVNELSILNDHISEYNEKITDQENRIRVLVQNYRWKV